MAVNLATIHNALATQIAAHITRETNVDAFPSRPYNPPSITVHSDPSNYLAYIGTFGPNGEADLMLRLKVEVDASDGLESVCLKIADYLSVGTGNGSSIPDAVMIDKTLGGVVASCVVLSAEWDSDGDPGVAWIPVQIILSKQNAQV